MCGIVGYLGKQPVVPVIMESLRTLEYRGYDSAGLAYLDDAQQLKVFKASGKLLNLEMKLNGTLASTYPSDGASLAEAPFHAGIGHIRWATHGVPNETNAHPHVSQDKTLAMVHNGIIENYYEIRKELEAKGIVFVSDTDTECVVQYLAFLAQQSPKTPFVEIIRQALQKLKGAYALTILRAAEPDKLYAVRNHAPLVIGLSPEDARDPEIMIASDTVAIARLSNRIIFLKDREIAEVTQAGVHLTNLEGETLTPKVEQVSLGSLQVDKKGYKHFMLKEIHEQPNVVRNSLAGRLVAVDQPIRLFSREADDPQQLAALLATIDRIQVVGCGTSYHAGLVGKYFIESLVKIPVDVESAGEYRYRDPVVTSKTLVIAISQSGETADTLEASRQAVKQGAKLLAMTNREESTLSREADAVLPVRAGIEVSVCATKSFTAQVMAFYLLGLALAEIRKTHTPAELEAMKLDLQKTPALMESILSELEPIQQMAKKYGHARDMLFIARGINFPVALEGALKLKEISYLHAEGYSGSELKHGPIAMLDENMPVVAVLTPGIVFEKMISNCQEAKAREAQLVGFVSLDPDLSEADRVKTQHVLAETFETLYEMPYIQEALSPLLTAIPLQLLAYYMAEFLGKDVDQPRNLAKSVTVE